MAVLWESNPDAKPAPAWRSFRWLCFWARLVLRVRRPLIIGVTGSVGKTTTKEYIHAVLAHPLARPVVGRVGRTRRNMNDGPNLPLVVLGFERFLLSYKSPLQWLGLCLKAMGRALRALLLPGAYPRVLVLEYGTSRAGRIAQMAAFAPPDIAVVTAIGPAHLSGLGNLAGVVAEKAALIRGMRGPGLVVLGSGHPFVQQLAATATGPVQLVSGRGTELAAAIARKVAEHLQVPAAAIEAGLATARSEKRRLDHIKLGEVTVIDDSFNANPLSMRLGLDTLADSTRPGSGRRIAVLGSMGELGEEAVRYHEEVATHARRCADLLIGVGELAGHYAPDRLYPDSDSCAAELPQLLKAGDFVLVKGSGSVKMGRIVKQLEASL